MRMVFWLLIWVLLLGFATIKVDYRDGLKVRLWGWGNSRDD